MEGAHLLMLLLMYKSRLLNKIINNIVLLLSNGPVQTCFASIVFVKPSLTKFWNEVFYHFQVTVSSSNVEDSRTILLVQDGNTYNDITHQNRTPDTHIRYTKQRTMYR